MLKKIWSGWRRFGQQMGDLVARVLLVIFYFTVALPFGLLMRLTQDPLDRKGPVRWSPRELSSRDMDHAKRSF